MRGGGAWHTDIEFEPLAVHASLLLVHAAPTRRGPAGTWVAPAEVPLRPTRVLSRCRFAPPSARPLQHQIHQEIPFGTDNATEP